MLENMYTHVRWSGSCVATVFRAYYWGTSSICRMLYTYVRTCVRVACTSQCCSISVLEAKLPMRLEQTRSVTVLRSYAVHMCALESYGGAPSGPAPAYCGLIPLPLGNMLRVTGRPHVQNVCSLGNLPGHRNP